MAHESVSASRQGSGVGWELSEAGLIQCRDSSQVRDSGDGKSRNSAD